MSKLKVLIIGGGIGGLAVAIAIRRQVNCDVHVYEKAEKLREQGCAFTLTPNGMKAVQQLGQDIYELVLKYGFDECTLSKPYLFLTWDGKLKFQQEFNFVPQRYHSPFVTIMRPKFLNILQNNIPPENIHCDGEFVGYHQDGKHIFARFKNGKEVRGDLLIGADGIASKVRLQTFGNHSLHYLGYTSIRGVSEFHNHQLIMDRPGFQSVDPGNQFYTMRLSAEKMYWSASPRASQGIWPVLSESDVKKRLLMLYKNWHPPIWNLIENVEGPLIVKDIYDRLPLKKWMNDRMVLLGDAAHPMSQFLGQGANMTLEDVIVLAKCLAIFGDDYRNAFHEYELKRMQRTYYIAAESRRIGMITHLQNPIVCWLRDASAKLTMQSTATSRRMDWFFDYTP